MKAKELNHWMRAFGYTDERLGDALGRTRETVNRWRNEKLDIPTWVAPALRGLENDGKQGS